jgi:hypothetical protein
MFNFNYQTIGDTSTLLFCIFYNFGGGWTNSYLDRMNIGRYLLTVFLNYFMRSIFNDFPFNNL